MPAILVLVCVLTPASSTATDTGAAGTPGLAPVETEHRPPAAIDDPLSLQPPDDNRTTDTSSSATRLPCDATVVPPTKEGSPPIFKIGVLSPASPVVGMMYEESIQRALGPSTIVPTKRGAIELVPVIRLYDKETCVQVARDLVEQEHVVAIIGPVESYCARAILADTLCVPLISPLASATNLTTQRNDWFFRTAVRDRDRLGRLREVKRQQNKWPPKHAVVMYDEADPFSSGLHEDMKALLPSAPKAVTTSNSPAWQATVPRAEDADVFVFTPQLTAQAIEFARSRDKDKTTLHFVGSNQDALAEAPEGSLVVGEASLDPEGELRPEALQLLQGLRASPAGPPLVVLSAYEVARYVLPSAIREAFDQDGRSERPTTATMRSRVRAVLDQPGRCFDSLQPPRKICFERGDIRELPSIPIYETQKGLKRVDKTESWNWFELDVPSELPLFEEPLRLQIRTRGTADVASTKVFISRDGQSIDTRTVRLQNGTAVVTFHPWWPGHYSYSTSGRYYPTEAATSVSLGTSYLYAAFAALIMSLLVNVSVGRIRRVVTGVIAGLLFAGICTYARSMVEAFPIPSFSPDAGVNAFIAGLLGGALGPRMTEVVEKWLR